MDHVFKKRTLGDLRDQVAALQLLSNEPACIHCNTLPLLTFARCYCKALLLMLG